jgi:predicted acyltransferase
MAVDVLRGIAIVMMVLVDVPGDAGHTPAQLRHVAWAGLHVADFVFPAFLVAAGAALGLARRPVAVRSALWRASRLFAIGLALVAIKYEHLGFESGTLQLIAVAWLVGALAMRLSPRRRLLVAIGLLGALVALHWGNWTDHGIDGLVDAPIFGERSDLGLLGMISASTAVMLASAAAQLLRGRDAFRRAEGLLWSGLVMMTAGGLLAVVEVPPIKRVWSPTYVLVTVGAVFVVWAALECVFVTDRRRALPLVALGRNALVVYVAMTLIGALMPDGVPPAFVSWAATFGGTAAASMLYSALVALALTVGAELLRRRDVVLTL